MIADLAPTADGDWDAWTRIGGVAKWSNMFDASDSTYIYTPTVGNRQSFFHESMIPGAIVSIKIYHRNQDLAGSTAVCVANGRLNNSDGADTTAFSAWNTWNWTTSPALARPGGGTWDYAEVNGDFETILRLTVGGANYSTSEWYARVDFGPYAGGFVFNLRILLPPIFGALGTLTAREWTEVRSALADRRLLRPGFGAHYHNDDEWARGVREARNHRDRTYFVRPGRMIEAGPSLAA